MALMSIEIGNFTFSATDLEGVTLITPKVRGDERGFFIETYQQDTFARADITADFVQDNHSSSGHGIFRGLHLQFPRYQEKIVRAISGDILDMAVQVYPEISPDFGKIVAVPLSRENHRLLHIGQSSYRGEPVLYAHGFLVTAPTAEVCYKASAAYAPADELGLNPFDCGIFGKNPLLTLDPEQMLKDNLINQRDYNWPGLEELAKIIWERVPERRKIVAVKKHVG